MTRSNDLILRPTDFAPSAEHWDPRLGSHAIERLGDRCYSLLSFPAGCAEPGDIVISNLEEAELKTCPHCDAEHCPVLDRVRKIADWRRFMRRR
jgi:hypothetical protein